MEKIEDIYFDWKYKLMNTERYQSYRKLFIKLDRIEYKYTIPLDENRLIEGVGLRFIFGEDVGIHSVDIMKTFDNQRCSVLEMLIALAIKCEQEIMWDPDLGDRTDKWFWEMLTNLNLHNMVDESFNEEYVEEVINKWLNRDYNYYGEGNIFVIQNPRQDLREVETWYQLCWYLEEIYKY